MSDFDPEVEQALSQIERAICDVRGDATGPNEVHPNDFNIPTGNDIKAMRERCDLSREQLAELINRSAVTVKNYETGTNAPSLKVMARLLIVFRKEWPQAERYSR